MKCATLGCNGTPTTVLVGTENGGFGGLTLNGTSLVFDSDAAFPSGETASDLEECALNDCSGTDMALYSSFGWAAGPSIDAVAGIAVSGTSLFWLDGNGNLTRWGDSTPFATGVKAIAADATNVYWVDVNHNVMQCAASGSCGTPLTLASGQAGVWSLEVNTKAVYWESWGTTDGTIRSCAIGGCSETPTIVASGLSALATFAVDETNVYMGTTAGLVKCGVAGCGNTPTIVVPGASIAGIALDATSVYWTDDKAGTVMKLTPK
jgi:hypothetical protein